MKNTILVVGLLSLFSFSTNAKPDDNDSSVIETDGRVHIVWHNPESYRDIRPVNQSKRSFQRNVFYHLDNKFEELSKDLPAQHSLKVTVNDIDLAGEVFFNGLANTRAGLFVTNRFNNSINEVRVIDRVHVPAIRFSFSVIDGDGQTVTQGEADLKDLNFLDVNIRSRRNLPFIYEKRMLDQWYSKTIAREFEQS